MATTPNRLGRRPLGTCRDPGIAPGNATRGHMSDHTTEEYRPILRPRQASTADKSTLCHAWRPGWGSEESRGIAAAHTSTTDTRWRLCCSGSLSIHDSNARTRTAHRPRAFWELSLIMAAVDAA